MCGRVEERVGGQSVLDAAADDPAGLEPLQQAGGNHINPSGFYRQVRRRKYG